MGLEMFAVEQVSIKISQCFHYQVILDGIALVFEDISIYRMVSASVVDRVKKRLFRVKK